jgi:hypothetical protein
MAALIPGPTSVFRTPAKKLPHRSSGTLFVLQNTAFRASANRQFFLPVVFTKSSSRYSLFRPHLPKVLRRCQFLKHFEMQLELCSVHFLLTTFPDQGPDPQTQTVLRQTHGATIPIKTRCFAPESVFTHKFTRSRTLSLPNYLMMGLTCDDVVDTMMWMLTMTIVRNCDGFSVNFLWLYR